MAFYSAGSCLPLLAPSGWREQVEVLILTKNGATTSYPSVSKLISLCRLMLERDLLDSVMLAYLRQHFAVICLQFHRCPFFVLQDPQRVRAGIDLVGKIFGLLLFVV